MREYEEYEENTHTRYEKDERRETSSILFFDFFCIPPTILSIPDYKKTSLAGVEPAIFGFVVRRVSIAPQAPYIIIPSLSNSLYLCLSRPATTDTLFDLYHW